MIGCGRWRWVSICTARRRMLWRRGRICRGCWRPMWRGRCRGRGWNFCGSCNGVGEFSVASEAKSVVTRSAEETIAWGREFARGLQAPLLVLLTGDLGSGKTTLTKGIVAGLGAADEEDVTSPTFTLVHVYGDDAQSSGVAESASASLSATPTPTSAKSVVYHGDLYRIESFH